MVNRFRGSESIAVCIYRILPPRDDIKEYGIQVGSSVQLILPYPTCPLFGAGAKSHKNICPFRGIGLAVGSTNQNRGRCAGTTFGDLVVAKLQG